MDISMFFVFPGLLITIGVVLMIISIIIIFVAAKSDIADIKVDASLITPYKDKNSDVNISKRKISTNKHIYDSSLVAEQPAMKEPDKPKKEAKKVEEKKQEIKEEKEEVVDVFEEEFKEEEPIKKPVPKKVEVKKEEVKKEEPQDDDDIELL